MTSAGASKIHTRTLRIALVEGHAIMRDGLKRLIELQPDFRIVGEFGGVEECLNGIRGIVPDVLLTELIFSGQTGIELLNQLRQYSPSTRALVLTDLGSDGHVRAALQAGAHGFVLKECRSDELMLALRTVAAGQQFLCRAIASKVLSTYLSGDGRPAAKEVAPSLTARERSVLTQIALGDSNKSIARRLGVSPKTVEKHRSNMMRKLQLRNVAAITMYAIRHGLAGSPPFHHQIKSSGIAIPA